MADLRPELEEERLDHAKLHEAVPVPLLGEGYETVLEPFACTPHTGMPNKQKQFPHHVVNYTLLQLRESFFKHGTWKGVCHRSTRPPAPAASCVLTLSNDTVLVLST